MLIRKKILKKIIREEISRKNALLLEATMWGVSAVGILVICPEDQTMYLQQRSDLVTGGQLEYSYPSGGIAANGRKEPQHYNTKNITKDMVPKKTKHNDEYEALALEEWKEETGMPILFTIKANKITATVDGVWNFHFYIATCTQEQKDAMIKQAKPIDVQFNWETTPGSGNWYPMSVLDGRDKKINLWDVAFNKDVKTLISTYNK
tara:strand:- start:133 stop:750 length:618 start_codon:yes stop_codon:yes gene_type:complete